MFFMYTCIYAYGVKLMYTWAPNVCTYENCENASSLEFRKCVDLILICNSKNNLKYQPIHVRIFYIDILEHIHTLTETHSAAYKYNIINNMVKMSACIYFMLNAPLSSGIYTQLCIYI